MNTKYTPGPWTASKDGYIDAPDGALIAKIHTEGSAASHDARVIAASPELLEALIDMLDCADALGRAQGEPSPEESALLDKRKAARAAIAKATQP
jgi:hypothetical protein